MERGSLRYSIVLWVRVTMGVGVLLLPNMIRMFGMVTGLLLIGIGGILSLMSFNYIIQVSDMTGINDY